MKGGAVPTSESPEDDSTIARVLVFRGKRSPDSICPSKAPETPLPTKVKSSSLETGTCQVVRGLGQFLGLEKGDLSVGLGVIFWEPLKLLTKSYGLIHLSWEGSEISFRSRRLKRYKKLKKRTLKRLKIAVLEFLGSSFSTSKNIFSNIRLQEGFPGESVRTKGGGGERRRPDIRTVPSLG